MSLDTLLALFYLTCFQAAAIPGVWKIYQKRSSATSSIGREILIIAGAATQLTVMIRQHAHWQVALSPVMTILGVSVLALMIVKYRHGREG